MRPLEQILNEYLEACLKEEEALTKGDSKTGNKQFRMITKIDKDLKSNPEYGIEKLVVFLDHPSDNVRYNTAYSLIPIMPEKAKAVLEEVGSKKGLVALNARMTLSEWEKGKLKFD